MERHFRPRATARLRLDRGTALLRQYGATSILCAMVDLSEDGCQCRMSLDDLDDLTAAAWKKVLAVGRVLGVEMTEPPQLRGLVFTAAEVRWVRALRGGDMEFGLHLGSPASEQKEVLGKAMLTFAAEKLRRATSAGTGAAAFTGVDAASQLEPAPAAPEADTVPPPPPGPRRVVPRPPRHGEMPRLRPSRRKIYLAAVFEFCGEKGEEWEPSLHQGRTVDISEGGFMLEGPAPECCGAKELTARNAWARVTIRTSDHDIKGLCRIRSVLPSRNMKHSWLYGLQIMDMPEKDRARLREIYAGAPDSAPPRKPPR
ncbi:MAG: PilZ domain-containing protein [Planctomycetota bacterium]|nr:PilZ domain-containing protein [Planctomycetota bacterium]